MLMKVFVLGCSGSGKSTAARYISMLARDERWSATHINDYHYLYKMYQDDVSKRKFSPAAFGGFDVIDPTAYNTVLLELEQEVRESSARTNELIIIEFARDDYRKTFKLFSDGFLQDAYFLFLDADPDTCIRRIHERATHKTTIDDHFVPKYIVEDYRHTENKLYMASGLKEDYNVPDQHIELIDNSGSLKEFWTKLDRFVKTKLPRVPVLV